MLQSAGFSAASDATRVSILLGFFKVDRYMSVLIRKLVFLSKLCLQMDVNVPCSMNIYVIPVRLSLISRNCSRACLIAHKYDFSMSLSVITN